MIVTLDTTVLYQALRSNTGASFYIMQRIRVGDLQVALSVPVFLEYREVLTRVASLQDFALTDSDVAMFLRFLAFVGKPYDIYFLSRPNLRDESDNKIVELALASQSKYLITSNVRDFRSSELNLDFLGIVTPGEFVRLWRKKNG